MTKLRRPYILLPAALIIAALSLLVTTSTFAAPASASTSTPKPSTRTPSPAHITATARASQVEATKLAKSAAATSTAMARATQAEATKEERSFIATSTAQARAETIYVFTEYLPANAKELINYADDYAGNKVFFSGRVFNIVPGGEAFQLFFTGTYDGAYVETSDPLDDLYEDDVVTVYGVVTGSYCFENNQGNQVCQPRIRDAYFFKKLTPEMQAARATAQVLSTNATREARAAKATEQAEQRATVQARISNYKTIAIRELMTYPEDHVGESVRVPGRVFNVAGSDGVLQMYAPGTYDGIYIELEEPVSDIYENDSIVVFGIVGGRKCFTNRAGGEICQPLIEEAFYTK